jgi:hypothetical protein
MADRLDRERSEALADEREARRARLEEARAIREADRFAIAESTAEELGQRFADYYVDDIDPSFFVDFEIVPMHPRPSDRDELLEEAEARASYHNLIDVEIVNGRLVATDDMGRDYFGYMIFNDDGNQSIYWSNLPMMATMTSEIFKHKYIEELTKDYTAAFTVDEMIL